MPRTKRSSSDDETGQEDPMTATRSAAQAGAAAEQQGNTFLSPLQAPRRLSGGERQRGGTFQLGQREASPEILGG